jgi:hypothetical protein
MTIFMIASGYSSQAHGTGINIPTDCFTTLEYCSQSEISRDHRNVRYIDIKFYGRVPNEYNDGEDLIKRFLDFQSWDDYTAGVPGIQFRSSGLISSRVIAGKRELSQYARYAIDAPWPAQQIEVVERTVYREMETSADLVSYWKFYTSRDFSHQGIKRKDGTLKVEFISPLNVYHVEMTMEVVPTTAFLKAARKAITQAINQLFLGMFKLK